MNQKQIYTQNYLKKMNNKLLLITNYSKLNLIFKELNQILYKFYKTKKKH